MKKLSPQQKNEQRLKEFLKSNGIEANNFEFWKRSFGFSVKTGGIVVTEPRWSKVNWYRVTGLSQNNFLIVENNFGKKIYIKEDFWNSSSSPFWKENNEYGILIRIRFDLGQQEQDLISSFIKENI
jgi:hypothetical protein